MKNEKSEPHSHTLPLEWDINISILKNPLLWFQIFMVVLLSSSYLLLLLVGLNLYENHWEDIPSSVLVFVSIGGSFFLAFSLIAFLFYGRGIPTKYVLRDGYIEQHTLSKGKKAVGLLGLFALLSGKNAGYTAAGASLLAHSREQIAVEWKDVFELQVFPNRKEIQLHNEWRTVMQIICPDDVSLSADWGACDAYVTVGLSMTEDNCAVDSVWNDFNGTADASGLYRKFVGF